MFSRGQLLIYILWQLLSKIEARTFECPGIEHNISGLQNTCLKPNTNLTLNAAFSALKYHRKMMNEFLLSSYLAELILNSSSSLPPQNFIMPVKLNKRTGLLANETVATPGSNREQRDNLSQNLLVDEGSTKYKNWLEKTVTYDDIQRQILQTDPHQNKSNQHRKSYEELGLDDDDEDYEGDFDYGDITGYAYTNTNFEDNPYDAKQYVAEPSNLFVQNVHKPIKKKNGYEAEYGEHNTHYIEEHPVPAVQQGHEIGLREIADITMITLAFLSFGTFILQVLICITMGKEDTTMAASEMEETEVRDEEIRRRRRSLPANEILKTENELSRLALFTIDTILGDVEGEDEVCRNWMLCRNSHLAKKQKSKAKYWLPMWSLSLSWIRSRFPAFTKGKQNSTDNMALFDNLKAIILGLTLESSCNIFYKDVCTKYTF